MSFFLITVQTCKLEIKLPTGVDHAARDYIPYNIQSNCLYTGNTYHALTDHRHPHSLHHQPPRIALAHFPSRAHNIWFIFQIQATVFVLFHVACVQNDVLVKSQQRGKQSCGLFVIEFTRVNSSDSSEQIRQALSANIDSSMMRAY
jgi:hypothetical protein